MKLLKTNNSTIACEITKHPSSNENIIFMHGLGLNRITWTTLLPYFEDYSYVVYDLRWHGDSNGPFLTSDKENWHALYVDFATVLSASKFESYHLVCHGLSVQLAIEMISQDLVHPKSITFLSTPGYYPPLVAKNSIKNRENIINLFTAEQLGEFMVPQVIRSKDSKLQKLVIDAYKKVDRAKYMDILKMNANALSLEKLTKIHVPTLLLNGEFDVNYPLSLTTIAANYLPMSKTRIINDASNMVHLDQPKETAQHIIEFIEDSSKQLLKDVRKDHLPYLHNVYHQSSQIPMKLLYRVDFLYGFSMKVDQQTVTGKWNQRKAKEVMSYLALHGTSTKDKLYAILWPESSKVDAQNALRVSINHLRKLLENQNILNLIHTNSHNVWIDENIIMECDVKEVLEKRVELILDLTRPIFPDFYSDWVMDIRYEIESKV